MRHMQADERKQQVIASLHFALDKERWQLIAYSVMINHYHAVLRAPDTGAQRLSAIINSIHRFTASQWNKEDGTPRRQVWWNYWDTCLTSEGSFYTRINYVHWNPVKHGLVPRPELYGYSTYRLWQEQWPSALDSIERDYPFDRVSIRDDF